MARGTRLISTSVQAWLISLSFKANRCDLSIRAASSVPQYLFRPSGHMFHPRTVHYPMRYPTRHPTRQMTNHMWHNVAAPTSKLTCTLMGAWLMLPALNWQQISARHEVSAFRLPLVSASKLGAAASISKQTTHS